jgi:hypothetical protein
MFAGVFVSTVLVGCNDTDARVVKRVAAPAEAPSIAPGMGRVRFDVVPNGTATFLIDAPLEKIRGRSTTFRGGLDVDTDDLTKTTGEIDVDLDALRTETFADADKNATQTGHAKNWLEIGTDVDAKTREENRWIRFTIRGLTVAGPARLGDVPKTNGESVVHVTARGDLWLHGASSPKTVALTATFEANPTLGSVHFVTDSPLAVSLREHDVKPRDIAGRFLNGALEKVGKKIDDQVQVSIDALAKTSGAT